ncbi:MAG: ABC transporter substrate-binding protein [Lachnospiraceae bacterium]
MRLKQGVAGIMTGLMLAIALVGCGNTKTETAGDTGNAGNVSTNAAGDTGSSGSSGSTQLTMAWWGNQTRNERTQEALNKYAELNPGVSVQGQFFQWDDYWSKMAASSAGNKLPDIIQMDYSYMDQYVNKGQLLDLSPYIESGALDVSNISDVTLEMGAMNDGNYALAAGVNSPALYYNESVLSEAGITIEDNMTMDAFIEMAKQVYEKTGYRASVISNGNYMMSWSRSRGIDVREKKMGAQAADDYIEYFAILEDGLKDGWHLPVDMSSSSIEQDPMVYGSSPQTMSWCTIDGSNLLTAYQNAANEGVKISMTTVPTADSTKSNYLKPSMLFAVSATTENPDASIAVLNYLINSVDANEILRGERGVPISSAVVEAISSSLSAEEQAVMSYINDVITPNCTPIGPPDPAGTSEVQDLLKRMEEKVSYGEYTAAQAAEEYFTKGNEIYQSN